MRVRYGLLKALGAKTGYHPRDISDYVNGHKRPGTKRLFVLESASGISARVWRFGSPRELKNKLNAEADRIFKEAS